MIEVMIDAIPMVMNYTLYIAKIYLSDDKNPTKVIESKESLRQLLKDLNTVVEEQKLDRTNIRILGEFNEGDLTEDDKIAWTTRISDL